MFLGRNGSTTRGQWQRDALRLSREPKGERSTDGSQDVELGSGRWGLTVFLQKMKNLLRVLSHPSPSLCFTGAGFWFSNWDPRPLLGFLTHLLSACRQVVVVKVSREALTETSENAPGRLTCSSEAPQQPPFPLQMCCESPSCFDLLAVLSSAIL